MGRNNEIRNCLASKWSEIWEKEEEGSLCRMGAVRGRKGRGNPSQPFPNYSSCVIILNVYIVDAYQRVCTYPRLF